MSLLGQKRIAGLEMDSYGIRVVELIKAGKSVRILNAGRELLPEGAVKDGRVLKPEAVDEALSKLWDRLKIKTDDVVLGISSQDIIFRFASFPKVPLDKLDNIISFNAQDFLPIPLDEVELDYIPAGEEQSFEGTMLRVLLVAARKNMIKDFIKVFDLAGLKLREIDVSTMAAARLLPESANSGINAVINIGYELTNVLILNDGTPQLAHTLTSQSYMFEQVGRCAAIQAAVYGKLPLEEIDSMCGVLAGEIQGAFSYHLSQKRDTIVDRIYLCGVGSRIAGISGRLSDMTGIPVEVIDPAKELDLSSFKKNMSVNEAADYGICISLAQRGLVM